MPVVLVPFRYESEKSGKITSRALRMRNHSRYPAAGCPAGKPGRLRTRPERVPACPGWAARHYRAICAMPGGT
jgi:hypothetical protein